jgi:hypothetical protein
MPKLKVVLMSGPLSLLKGALACFFCFCPCGTGTPACDWFINCQRLCRRAPAGTYQPRDKSLCKNIKKEG